MNWSEAIKAMSEGEKVRDTRWASGKYISDSECTTEFYHLWSEYQIAEWELYEEESPYEESPYEEIIADILADTLNEIMALSIFKSSK